MSPLLLVLVGNILFSPYHAAIMNTAILTTSQTSQNGATISIPTGYNTDASVDNVNGEWDITVTSDALAQQGYHLQIDLDSTWGFHPTQISTIELIILSDTPSTMDLDLLVSFSVVNNEYFTVWLAADNYDRTSIYPAGTSFATGHVKALVDAVTSFGSTLRDHKCTGGYNNGNMEPDNLNCCPTHIVAWPMFISLTNNPINHNLVATIGSGTWSGWTQTHSYTNKEFTTGQGLQIYMAMDDPDEAISFQRFKINYKYGPTTTPTPIATPTSAGRFGICDCSVSKVDSSALYPANTNNGGFVSTSDDALAVFAGGSIHFQGTAKTGGLPLVYDYRIECMVPCWFTNIAIGGAAWQTSQFRVFNGDKSTLYGSNDVSSSNSFMIYNVDMSGNEHYSKEFRVIENNVDTNWRYRSFINISMSTQSPTTSHPSTSHPTTSNPTTNIPSSTSTTQQPIATTLNPTTDRPTTIEPTTNRPSTAPITAIPTTNIPTTMQPSTSTPSTSTPTTSTPTTDIPTTIQPTLLPTSNSPTTYQPSNIPTGNPLTLSPSTPSPQIVIVNAPTGAPIISTSSTFIDILNTDNELRDETHTTFIYDSKWHLILLAAIVVLVICAIICCIYIIKRKKNADFVSKKDQQHLSIAQTCSPYSSDTDNKSIQNNTAAAVMMTSINTHNIAPIPQYGLHSVASLSSAVFLGSQFETNLSSLVGANSILMDDVVADMGQNNVEDDDIIDDITTAGGNTIEYEEGNENTPPTGTNEDDDQVIGGYETFGGPNINDENEVMRGLETNDVAYRFNVNIHDINLIGQDEIIIGDDEEDEMMGGGTTMGNDDDTAPPPPPLPPMGSYNNNAMSQTAGF